jgi:DNA-binding NarL/FixJ family response regulator
MTIRVVLADDQALLRATFRLLLDSIADIEVVGEAATGAEAVQQARTTRGTAKTHVNLAMMKTNAPDRAQLVVLAYEAGLVNPT